MRKLIGWVFRGLKDILELFVVYLPGETGIVVRRWYYKRQLRYLGRNVRIEPGVYFQHPGFIEIGDNSLIGRGAVLLAGLPTEGKNRRMVRGKNKGFEGILRLGKDAHIAPYCTISGMGGLIVGDHTAFGAKASVYTFTQISYSPNVLFTNGMTIGENVMIGTNSTVIGIAEIPDGEIIRPNSFVCETIERRS